MSFDILVKSLAGAAIIAAILILTKAGKTQAAGLLVLFPVITLLSYYFIGSNQGPEELRKVVRASLLSSPIWLVFIGVVYVAVKHLDYRIALTLGITVWAVVGSLYLLIVHS